MPGLLSDDDTLVSRLLELVEADANKVYCDLQRGETKHTVTYGSLFAGALRCAESLRQHGVRKGDVVLIFLPTDPIMYSAFAGTMLLGAIPSYMPCPSVKQDASQFWRTHRLLMNRIRPAAILTDAATASAMREAGMAEGGTRILIAAEADVEMPSSHVELPASQGVALLQHSSGTTGLKKGVPITHRALRRQINEYGRAIGISSNDVIATWLPVYHDMGLITSTLMPMMLGLRVVALDPFEWSAIPISLLSAMTSEKATLTWLPNFAFEHLVRSSRAPGRRLDLAHVRAFINCSERCFPQTFERFHRHFADAGVRRDQLQVCYAMAETVFAISQTKLGHEARTISVCPDSLRARNKAQLCDRPDALALISNGPVLEGTSLSIVDSGGRPVADRKVGEVAVSGPCVFEGYFGRPELTIERLHAKRFRTKDRGFVLDGEVYLLGRTDDLLIVRGKNFHASEIEAAVNGVMGVKPGRVVVSGVENAETGTIDVVVVAETDLTSHAELLALKRRIKNAVFQELSVTIHSVRFAGVGTLRKTTSGKISRERSEAPHTARAPAEALTD